MIPASGSHQNTWHSKRCVPPSTITAKVWLSWPTPRKVRKRTWHSQKGSSPSCRDQVQQVKQSFGEKPTWQIVLNNDGTSPFHRDRTLSVMWITVGSQSSLSVEFMMLSIARFSTSIPVQCGQVLSQLERCRLQQVGLATPCGYQDIFWPVSDLPMARDTGRLPMYWTSNFWTCFRTASRNSTETMTTDNEIKEMREQQVMWGSRTGESPCLGRSSGETLSMVRERDGLSRDFSDIICRHRRIQTGSNFYCGLIQTVF